MQHTLKKFIIIIIGCLIHNSTWGQETASVQVIARSLPTKILLRWAVDQPLEWKKANEYGFFVERATISRNGEAVVPIETQMLTPYPLKPKPLMEWEILANQDQNVAVLAQALFGNSFETTTPNTGTIGKITAVNDEVEQRFTFGLLAAEQNFEGALLAGWGLEDATILPSEKYVYKVRVALPIESSFTIKDGSVFAGSELYEDLPIPIGLAAAFKDSNVLLSWNFNLLSDLYTSYIVECSEDGNSYQQQNKRPIFSASQDKENEEVSMFYTDSIPNDKKFYYRIKGKTAFGETGPATNPLQGKSIKALGFVPRISNKKIPDDNTAILKWDFKEEGNDLITGFELRRGNKVDGPFTTVQKDIAPHRRETTFKGLKRINYFTIVAMGKNGIESPSFATIVQPVDSIPPTPPINLQGIADTTGIVKISWSPNIEEDLSGYRIFTANNPTEEFSEITNVDFKETTYTDTIPVKNLNTKIYYKVKAMDNRYNASEFSEIVTVDKPDIIPPSPPVLKQYLSKENEVFLEWIPSSSSDVVTHLVFRKNTNDVDALWEEIAQVPMEKKQEYADIEATKGNSYVYIILAKDKTGLESTPTTPIHIIAKGKIDEQIITKFNGTVNRELRFINLSWKVKDQNVLQYRLYKATNKESLKLYKTLTGDAKSYNDTDLEINSNYIFGLQLVLQKGKVSPIKKINIKY